MKKILTFVGALLALVGAQTSDLTQSDFSPALPIEIKAEFDQTVTFISRDSSGNQVFSSSDTFALKVEQLCERSSTIVCTETSEQDNVLNVPTFVTMTGDGLGSYSATLKVTGGAGTVSVSAIKVGVNGIVAKYYANNNWTGTPVIRENHSQINMDWGNKDVGPINSKDNVSAYYYGFILLPYTGTVTFYIDRDDYSEFTIGTVVGGTATTIEYPDSVLGELVPYRLKYKEHSGSARVKLKWSYIGQSATIVPAANFYKASYTGIQPHTVEVLPMTVPQESTHNGPATLVAGSTFAFYIQSRNGSGVAHDVSTDIYTVCYTHESSVSSCDQSVQAAYVANGLYLASFDTNSPTQTGSYSVSITCQNDYTVAYSSILDVDEVKSTPFTLTVTPAPPYAPNTYFNNELDNFDDPQTAGVPFEFEFQYVDEYGNHHTETMQDEIIDPVKPLWPLVVATYDNHDVWESQIEVTDDPVLHSVSQVAVAGAVVYVSGVDDLPGRTIASLNIFRAGYYYVQTTIYDPAEALGNSISDFYVIEPDVLDPTKSVAKPIEATVYAGYTYGFQIQGRDQYRNNVLSLVEEVLETSVVIRKWRNKNIFVEGTIVDDEFEGIYYVEVSLPKTLEEGTYKFEVLIDNMQVPTDNVKVYPCTNQEAYNRGLVSKAGKAVYIEDVEYVIGSEMLSVELSAVDFYCDHSPIIYFQRARRLTTQGQELIDELVGLEQYGITLQPHGLKPTLEFLTNKMENYDATFEFEFIATVEEEVTWFNYLYVLAEIKTEPVVFNSTVEMTQEFPKFNVKSVSENTLSMLEDASGSQFLVPVVIDCNTEWARTLPSIEGEEEGEKFQVTVNLDKTKKFLNYDPSTREFQVRTNARESVSQDFYLITIQIKDSNGKKSQYNLRVSYGCMLKDVTDAENILQNDFELRYDENPPTPYIHSVSQYGEVRIRFNETMNLEAALPSQDFSKGRRFLQTSEEDSEKVFGQASTSFSNFTQVHNGTFTIAGTTYPSISIYIEPSDPDSMCSELLTFSWELVEFTQDEVVIQIEFDRPECVSSSGGGDLLIIQFHDQRLFEGSSGKLVWPEIQTKRLLGRQLPSSGAEKEALETVADSASTAIMATSFINVLTNLLLQGSLSSLVSALKNLQLLVHIMLIQVYLVAHAEIFLGELQKLIAFEFYDFTDIAVATFQAEANIPVDAHFESVGYETSDAIINSGLIAFIIFLAPVILTLMYVLKKYCCWQKARAYFQKQLDKTFWNGVITFIDASFLVLGVCCAVNIYQVYKGVASKNFSYYFAISMIFSINPYLLVLLGYLCRNFQNLGSDQIKKRFASAYEDYDLKGAGRTAFVYMVLSYVRRVALCFVITFGRESIVAQLFFTNFCSILVISFIGIVRPFKTKAANTLELINEYTILLLYCHCVTQTDFVQDPLGRMTMGWSLIGLISINIAINFGNMIIRDLFITLRKLKLYYLKKKWVEKVKEAKLRKEKIDNYRKIALEDFCKYGKLTIIGKSTDLSNSVNVINHEDNFINVKSKPLRSPASQQVEPHSDFLKVQIISPEQIENFKGEPIESLEEVGWNNDQSSLDSFLALKPRPKSHAEPKQDLSETRLVLTKHMLQVLYDEEVEKLGDANYYGGGLNVPYGPSVQPSILALQNMGFNAYRRRYITLLEQAIAELS